MNWDTLQLGVVSGSIAVEIDDAMVDEFVDAMEIADDRFAAKPGARRQAPSHAVPKIGLYPLYIDYLNAHIGDGVFAKQHFRFIEPIFVGDTISATGRLVEKYERRGKHYVVFEGEFKNAAGTPVLYERRTIMVVSPEFTIRD